ncbi:nucleotide exchange factor GrpE [uncultured Fibrobacter sp.]|uniref:nucleotide exchange factor GrpE n=1 Tax=uncultured Fibrobacter sp. TaxID=261512 RepID=UPI0025E57922|nr:nucleotide exchange factor GrpE [uncultured Fibrobacter sp.]
MAEEKNPEQNVEPNDAERAQFEQDVLKAAQDAMNLEAEANASAGSATDNANAETKENRHPEQSEGSSEAPASEKAAEQPAAPSAEEVLKQQLADANDRFVRLMAEFENFRRRNAKEQLELIETANGKLLEKLSEVQDNFERAFASENKAKDLEAFEKGMQMIYNQFAKVLTDAGLEQIDPTGKEFDPNLHEALMQQPSETIPEGHVVTVFQKGYKLKNKILKTAKVIVSSGK